MDLGITGKQALVCGASRGLGLGCARALAREGVHVLLVARGAPALEAAAAALRADPAVPRGTRVQTLAADITTEAGRDAALLAGVDAGGFDIVVTNAGGPPPGDFRDWGDAQWHAALNANMLTPIALMRATVDGMAERGFGRIVNITSSAVKAPIDILGLSNGARSGLTGFVAGLARNPRLVSRGVTINNLLPGAFDTDRLRATLEASARRSGEPVAAVAQARIAGIPAGRFGTPDEFGALCAFVCSAHAGYLTGQNLLLDGGAYPGAW